MTTMQLSDHVPPPTQPTGAFLAHETECRKVFLPLLEDLLDRAEQAGWDRRTVASTLMFLSAKQVSAAGSRNS